MSNPSPHHVSMEMAREIPDESKFTNALTWLKNQFDKLNNPSPRELFIQPIGSKVRFEILENGIKIEVPPAGVWKGSFGVFKVGLILLAINIGATLLFIIAQSQRAGISVVLSMFVTLSPFWIGAICLLIAGWCMGRRHVIFAVADEKLMILRMGAFRTQRLEWHRSEIANIDMGPSRLEESDAGQVMELQILGPKGKLFGMMWRDDQELIWMSTLLRYAVRGFQFPSEVHASLISKQPVGSPLPALAEGDSPTKKLSREIAAFYAHSLCQLACVFGKMTLFFSWVPILGMVMTIFVGGLGLLLAVVAFLVGIYYGPELRRMALKAAGACLLGILISAASTAIFFVYVKLA